ncbi:MAG: DUF3291 domain-containing protein [Sinimarinibacterium flocculans]|uniref:DUF3291 domain-containing protein n=1 Tax=Sinimarinibacterium flocculans TaxID=985250 RepID=UPI003C65D64E
MQHHLAQINIARFRLPMADPANAEFVGNLDRVNAIAEAQPGFVWRLKGDGNNALDIQAFDDPNMAINMSVWTDLDALAAFVYRNMDHREIMGRRREWFERIESYMALWWIPAGHIPSAAEGKARLDLLARLGPTPEAFVFRQPFAPPGAESVAPVLDRCA